MPFLRPEDPYPECVAGAANEAGGGESGVDVWTECCTDHYRGACAFSDAAVRALGGDFSTIEQCLRKRAPHNACD